MIDKDAMERLLQSTIELGRAQRQLAKTLTSLQYDEAKAIEAEEEVIEAEREYEDAGEEVTLQEQALFLREHRDWGKL